MIFFFLTNECSILSYVNIQSKKINAYIRRTFLNECMILYINEAFKREKTNDFSNIFIKIRTVNN